MIKKILLPLDGSHSALEFAVKMAKRTSASITALMIIDEPEIMVPEPVPAGAGEFVEHKHKKLLEKAHEHNQTLLAAFSKTCKEEGIEQFSIEIHGSPSEVIINQSHMHDLIVIPRISHFKSITQEGPCKTPEEVIRKTSRPLFLIPEKLHKGKDAWVAYDGGNGGSKTMQLAQMSGILKGVSVTVVSVDKDREKAAKNCEAAKSFLQAHGIETKTNPMEYSGKAWEILLKEISSSHPEFVTMGSFEISALKEFFLGSFTKGMLENSPVPLFVYH